MLCRGADDNVGETRGMALPPCPVRHRAGYPCYLCVEDKNSVAVQMQDGLQPRRQVRAFAPCPLTP